MFPHNRTRLIVFWKDGEVKTFLRQEEFDAAEKERLGDKYSPARFYRNLPDDWIEVPYDEEAGPNNGTLSNYQIDHYMHAWNALEDEFEFQQDLDTFYDEYDRALQEQQDDEEEARRQLSKPQSMKHFGDNSKKKDGTRNSSEKQQQPQLQQQLIEVIVVSACTQVTPEEVYWTRKLNETCYADVPVLLNGTIWYVHTGTRELKRESTEIDCAHRPVTIYQDAAGRYVTPDGHVVHVTSLTHRVAFRYHPRPLDLRAPTIFRADQTMVATSLSMLEKYVKRINRLEGQVAHLAPIPQYSFTTGLSEAVRDVKSIANNTLHSVKSEIQSWTLFSDWFTEWYHYAIT
ncbi:hypothetical protein AAVH_38896, partial [Aphelenchoides avenae]